MVYPKNQRERGLTIAETMVVLVIMAVAAAAVALSIGFAIRNSKIEKTAEAVTTIEKTVVKIYNNKRDFQGLNQGVLIASGLIPTAMIDTGNNLLRTPFGSVSVTPISSGCAGCNNGFSLTVNELPSDVCVKFASRDFGSMNAGMRVSHTSNQNFVNVLNDLNATMTECQKNGNRKVELTFVR